MRTRTRLFGGALAALTLVAAGSVFVIGMGPASAAPVPPPLGQTNNTNVASAGCANGGNPFFDGNGETFGPVGVAVSPTNGRVWVQDFRDSDSKVNTGRLISWASVAAAEACTAPTTFGLAEFNQPEGLAFDAAGNLFMTETGNSFIYKWSVADQLAGPTKANADLVIQCWKNLANTFDCDADPVATRMTFPRGLAVGPDNLLYVADDAKSRILAFNITGANNAVVAPTTIIPTPGCAPKAVSFVGGKLFFANFTACAQGPVGVHRLNGTAAASTTEASAALAGAIDLGSSGTTLFATSVNGSVSSFANAATGALTPVTKTQVTLNGFTGSYTLVGPTFGVADGGGGTMLLADSGAFRVLKFSAVPVDFDLSIDKSHTGNFTVGQNGTFSIVVTNNGPTASSGTVTVGDSVPASLTLVSAAGTGWNCVVAGQDVSCTRNDALNAAASYPAITLTVTPTAAAVPTAQNQALLTNANDTNGANNIDTDTVTVNAAAATAADLSVDGTLGPLVAGQQGTLNLTVTNAGPSPTSQGTVIVTINLPTGVTFVSGSGTGFVCGAAGQTVTCTRTAPLAAGSSVDLAIVVAVGPNAVTGSVITISVADPAVTDPNPANNGRAIPITLVPAGGTGTGFFTGGTPFNPFNGFGAGFNPLGFLGGGVSPFGLPGAAPASGGQQEQQQQQVAVAPAAAAPAATGRIPFTGRGTKSLVLFGCALLALGLLASMVKDLAPSRRRARR